MTMRRCERRWRVLLNSCSMNWRPSAWARSFSESLSADQPECLVVDQHMPEMTGLDLQHHLRRSGIKIPAIIITAHDQPGPREQCRAAGAIAAYLLKLLNENDFLDAIFSAINRRQAQ